MKEEGKEREKEEETEHTLALRNKSLSFVIAEFMEHLIHVMLYRRGIYPAAAFHPSKYMDSSTQICKHPEVAKYVKLVAESVQILNFMDNENIKIVLIFLYKNPQSSESYAVDLSTGLGNRMFRDEREESIRCLKEDLRSVINSLYSHLDAKTFNLERDASFRVKIYVPEQLADRAIGSFDEHLHWIKEKNDKKPLDEISPISSFVSDLISINLSIISQLPEADDAKKKQT